MSFLRPELLERLDRSLYLTEPMYRLEADWLSRFINNLDRVLTDESIGPELRQRVISHLLEGIPDQEAAKERQHAQMALAARMAEFKPQVFPFS